MAPPSSVSKLVPAAPASPSIDRPRRLSSVSLPPPDLTTERVLATISWAEDVRDRASPQHFTELLHDAVPVLRWTGWHCTETGEGFAKTVLPLNYESTNQHGTHQAALMVLALDYTGGIALSTILRGFPIVGVHPQRRQHPSLPDDSAALWLINVDIAYKMPSAGDLVLTARVPDDQIRKIRDAFYEGRRVILPLDVELRSEGHIVATARATYFVRRSSFLRPSTTDENPNVLFSHLTKASARLIAGLRAVESANADPLCVDVHAAGAAGIHGKLLAERFTAVLPQLRGMVAARTRDLDDHLKAALAAGIEQVVIVGVGFDCRPFRLLKGNPHVDVFELDLPTMLEERARVLATLVDLPEVARTLVPFDACLQNLDEVLRGAKGFDPARPTFFVFEGCSMYFRSDDSARLLRAMASLMKHPKSRLWLDVVDESVIAGTTGSPQVERFLRGMATIGEPFVFGIDERSRYFEDLGYERLATTVSGSYRNDSDPVFGLYRFYLLGSGRG